MPFRKGNDEWKKRKTNKGGRPPRPVEEKYRKAILQRCTAKQWKVIIDVAIAKAQAGDKDARNWLSDWCMGKPIERKDVRHSGSVEQVLRWADSDDDVPSPIASGAA